MTGVVVAFLLGMAVGAAAQAHNRLARELTLTQQERDNTLAALVSVQEGAAWNVVPLRRRVR